MKVQKIFLVILAVLLIDQSVKVWVKTHMRLNQEIEVIDGKFKLHFTENEGMAFGMTFGGETGKIILTLFRIAAVIFIGFFLRKLVRQSAHPGLIVCLALIMAGALGNIIDSVIYGVLFTESNYALPAEFAPGNGYGTLLHGRVVDMLYFPLIEGNYPEWFPFVGGKHFLFFSPIFNIADASITTGVLMILLFQKRFFKKEETHTHPEYPAQRYPGRSLNID